MQTRGKTASWKAFWLCSKISMALAARTSSLMIREASLIAGVLRRHAPLLSPLDLHVIGSFDVAAATAS